MRVQVATDLVKTILGRQQLMLLLSIELLIIIQLSLVLQQVLVLVKRIGVIGDILVERLGRLLQIDLHLFERVRLLVTSTLACGVNHHRPGLHELVILVNVHALVNLRVGYAMSVSPCALFLLSSSLCFWQ